MSTNYNYNAFPPHNFLHREEIIPFTWPASTAIACYDGLLSAIPNAEVLLSYLSTQEAVLSSRIEGTSATLGEVLEFDAAGDTGQYDAKQKLDIFEILNYRKAMYRAAILLESIPLSHLIIS